MTSTVAEPGRLPLRRKHLADDVFSALASEILRGELAPDVTLPPERALSERFGVSKLLIRQAIHRLAEAGLVQVRQGGATRVLDPAAAPGTHVFELYYKLAPNSSVAKGLARDVFEKQFTQGLSLVEVFARRASSAARRELVTLVDASKVDASGSEEAMNRLEESFWRLVSEGGGNRILAAEVRWWYASIAPRTGGSERPPAVRYAFYAELARKLKDGGGAVAFYLGALTPDVNALFEELERGATSRERIKGRRP